MKKSRGKLGGSTRKLAKSHKDKGMQPVTKYLQEFEEGERVIIKIVSSEPKGMPHPRFQGRAGTVKGRQGKSYVVEITDGKARKDLVVTPVHLRKGKAAA